MDNGWENVNKNSPCEICGKPDWCSNNSNFILCRRVKATGAIEKCGTLGDYYLYPRNNTNSDWVANEQFSNTSNVRVVRADAQTLNEVYSKVLDSLVLTANDLDSLGNRGLSDSAIYHRGYKSINANAISGVVTKLRRKFSDEKLLSVPGFYSSRSNEICFSSPYGIMVPVRNLEGGIVAIKIRSNNSVELAGSKYLYLSSKRRGGTSPGAPIHYPLSSYNSFTILRITEGELKADIATEMSREYTIGLPSVGAWRSIEGVVNHFRPERVFLAFDMDADTNPHVASALIQAVELVKKLNVKVEVEKWK